jgi:phosphoketolase
VVSKRDVADLFTPLEAKQLVSEGAVCLDWASYQPEQSQIVLTAIGGYQLQEVLKAAQRLRELKLPHSVVYLLEPGRFRVPRDAGELAHVVPAARVQQLYPAQARVFVTHTRPEPMLGTLQALNTGFRTTRILGFVNQGGTLNTPGMLFINRSTWGHVLLEVSQALGTDPSQYLKPAELDALHGHRSPEGIII